MSRPPEGLPSSVLGLGVCKLGQAIRLVAVPSIYLTSLSFRLWAKQESRIPSLVHLLVAGLDNSIPQAICSQILPASLISEEQPDCTTRPGSY